MKRDDAFFRPNARFITMHRTFPQSLPPGLEGHAPLPARVLGRVLDDLALPLLLLLLLDDPRLAPLLHPRIRTRGLPPRVHNVHVVHALHHVRNIPARTGIVAPADREDEVHLHVLRPGVVLENTGAEASAHGSLGNHVPLRVILRVELTHGTPPTANRRIQSPEEPREPPRGRRVAALSIAKPLYSRDTNRSIKRSGPERHSLPNIREHEVPLDVALQRNVKHRRRDVHSDPGVGPAVGWLDGREDLTREAAAAADVEDERGPFQVKEVEGAVGH